MKNIIKSLVPKSIQRLFRCVWRFRLFGGLRIYRALKQAKGTICINVPGFLFPIEMRAGTSDVDVFRKVFLNREYEIATPVPVKFIVDAGANIGLATLYFAHRFPTAKIIAIEPEDSNFTMLKTNTRYYPNITIIQAGLWPNSTYLRIRDAGYGKWGFMTEEADDQRSAVKTVTIEELLQRTGTRTIDILKIDIEGAEKELFENNYRSWIDGVGLFIIELHDRFKPGCSTAFHTAIAPLSLAMNYKGENIIATKV